MTALIWMLAWLPHVLPAMSELPKPVNVTLTSDHFIHMLTWQPGPGTPAGVCYRVTTTPETNYSLEPVAGCECVQHPLVCNLTQALLQHDTGYFIGVTALLEGRASEPSFAPVFKPIEDTVLDPPQLTVAPCDGNLCVDPLLPLEHLRGAYDTLHCKLKMEHTSGYQEQDIGCLERHTFENLAPGREYCVSVSFRNNLHNRKSNYSQPVCAFIPSIFSADVLISTVLCSLGLLCVPVLVALFYAGVFIWKKRPLPLVLTSFHHIEGVPFIEPCRTSLSSLLNLNPTPPSSGEKGSSQTLSDESDAESETEGSGGNRGGNYKHRLGTNLLSSSLTAPLYPEHEPTQDFSSDQTSGLIDALPTETRSSAGLDDALSAHPAPHSDSPPQSDQCASDPPGGSDSLTGVIIEPNEEEEEEKEVVVEVGGSQDVNLLTLTFGRFEEAAVEEEDKSHAASEVFNSTPLFAAQTLDNKETALEMVSCSVDEEEDEEEDEDAGYIGRY